MAAQPRPGGSTGIRMLSLAYPFACKLNLQHRGRTHRATRCSCRKEGSTTIDRQIRKHVLHLTVEPSLSGF